MKDIVDEGLRVGKCMVGGSLGGTLKGVLSRYWSLESLHSTTGKCISFTQRRTKHMVHYCFLMYTVPSNMDADR